MAANDGHRDRVRAGIRGLSGVRDADLVNPG